MLRIVIRTENTVLSYGIKYLLHAKLQIAEIADAYNAAQADALLHRGAWDLLILDGALPGLSSLQVLEKARLCASYLPVLVMNLRPDALVLPRVLKAGASGYLATNSAPEEFVRAVRILTEGGRYVSASLAEQMVFSRQKIEQAEALLSNRELQVIHLIAGGKTISEIARMLSLSVKTISTYRARILKKMGMQTTAELIRYAVQNGLVE
jgi:DNA-binding NarL/FixJ family response regulator